MTRDSITPSVADPAPVMPNWSRYAGSPVDVSRRRSIRIRDTQENGESEPDQLTVDYLFHDGDYWTATIPLDSVRQVHGQAFNFSAVRTRRTAAGLEVLHDRHGLPKRRLPILNHVQSRFRFEPGQGIRLFPLGDTQLDVPVAEVDDLVYSLEVTGPCGVKFNLRDGLGGHLLSAHRILSTQEMVFERLVVENQVVTESPALDLTAEEMRHLLQESLWRSHHAGLQEPYYLFRCWGTNNCTSSPLQILDRVVNYSWSQKLGSLLYRLPLMPRLYLRIRGLDSSPGIRRLLKDEFTGYIEDQDTQQRRREHVITVNARKKAHRAAQQNN